MPNYKDDVFEDYGFCWYDYLLTFNGSERPVATPILRFGKIRKDEETKDDQESDG